VIIICGGFSAKRKALVAERTGRFPARSRRRSPTDRLRATKAEGDRTQVRDSADDAMLVRAAPNTTITLSPFA
jgi:hypothetical protein